MIVCIIPARGGSKRLPRKNVLSLNGKPLLAYSIEHAKNSKYITKVIVSTDDSEIASISSQYGAEVILRPSDISDDQATSESALLHALGEVKKQGCRPDLIVFLQCTSPIRNPDDIDKAIETFHRENADSLFSVCHNDRFLWRRVSGLMQSLNYDFHHRQRDQDHPEEFRENGSIYIFKPSILKELNNRLGSKIAVYEMDYWSSFQVDTYEHLELCEWIIRRKKKEENLKIFPKNLKLLVSDFDGVMTNNKVIVNQDGVESVICDRSDSWGLSLLRKKGVEVVVLSTERNTVVKARCDKLGLRCYQDSKNKLDSLKLISSEYKVPLDEIIYLGNDTNDLDCFRHVGCGVAVSDAHPQILGQAKIILSSKGGHGALQELCSLILEKIEQT